MPFGFGRKRNAEDQPLLMPEEEQEEAPPVPIVGDLPCTERGCDATTAAPCEYVDRRGRSCGTAWCPAHQAVFDAHAFCRRHVGTLRAIGIDIVERALAPDLDNRAPSLVNWVCNDLDERVRAFLSQQVVPGTPEELGEERVHLIRSADGSRRWERSWKLFDHTGVTTKVTVSVDETDDTMVSVRLGRDRIADWVPPWIERRKKGVRVEPDQDVEERRTFYQALFDRICEAVVRDRRGDRRY